MDSTNLKGAIYIVKIHNVSDNKKKQRKWHEDNKKKQRKWHEDNTLARRSLFIVLCLKL